MRSRTPERLHKPGRHDRIVSELKTNSALRVGEIARLLGVSTETIRRDLAELDQRGLINRTYGGAVQPVSHEPALSDRELLMTDERKAIAHLAVDQIERNDILMIGGGSTTLHFARTLSTLDIPMTVITHSFGIASELGSGQNRRVLILPGQFDGREGLIHGADTVAALEGFRANKAFLGATGLTSDGPHDASMGPGLVYRAMLQRSSHAFVLTDHTKFDQPSLFAYSQWNSDISLISDDEPSGDLAETLALAGVAVLTPKSVSVA